MSANNMPSTGKTKAKAPANFFDTLGQGIGDFFGAPAQGSNGGIGQGGSGVGNPKLHYGGGESLGAPAGVGDPALRYGGGESLGAPVGVGDPRKSYGGGVSLANGGAASNAALAAFDAHRNGPGSGNGGFLGGQSPVPVSTTLPSYLRQTPAAAQSQADQAIIDQLPAQLQLGPVPTLTMPTQGYNDYLSQAQKSLNFGAIGQPYDQASSLVGQHILESVANIGAAAQGAQQDIAGGTAGLMAAGQQANTNNAAVEAALAQQSQGIAQANGASSAGIASALGLGSGAAPGGGNAAAQNIAAQDRLAAATQNNQAVASGTTQAQVADNQNYGRVVDAKATTDAQTARMSGADTQAGIGLQKGSALLQAREAAAQQAVSMQQNAVQNALGAYSAKLGGWNALAAYGENQQQYGLQKGSLQAQILAAQEGAINNSNANTTKALENINQFGGTNPEVSGQILQNSLNSQYNDPILRQLMSQNQYAPLPLTADVLKKYHLQGH